MKKKIQFLFQSIKNQANKKRVGNSSLKKKKTKKKLLFSFPLSIKIHRIMIVKKIFKLN